MGRFTLKNYTEYSNKVVETILNNDGEDSLINADYLVTNNGDKHETYFLNKDSLRLESSNVIASKLKIVEKPVILYPVPGIWDKLGLIIVNKTTLMTNYNGDITNCQIQISDNDDFNNLLFDLTFIADPESEFKTIISGITPNAPYYIRARYHLRTESGTKHYSEWSISVHTTDTGLPNYMSGPALSTTEDVNNFPLGGEIIATGNCSGANKINWQVLDSGNNVIYSTTSDDCVNNTFEVTGDIFTSGNSYTVRARIIDVLFLTYWEEINITIEEKLLDELNIEITSMPVSLAKHRQSSIENNIVITGGIKPDGNLNTNAYIYFNDFNLWTSVMGLLNPVHSHGQISYKDKVYIFGGNNNNGPVPFVQIYDLVSNSWTNGTLMPIPLFNFSITRQGPNVIITGGITNISGTVVPEISNKTLIYNLESDSWTYGSELINAVFSHLQLNGEDGEVIIGGGKNTPDSTTNEFYSVRYGIENSVPSLIGTFIHKFSNPIIGLDKGNNGVILSHIKDIGTSTPIESVVNLVYAVKYINGNLSFEIANNSLTDYTMFAAATPVIKNDAVNYNQINIITGGYVKFNDDSINMSQLDMSNRVLTY
jgi:hypothetical protein